MIEIDVCGDEALIRAAHFGEEIPALIGDKGRAVKNLPFLVADAVRGDDGNDVRNGVTDQRAPPARLGVEAGIFRLRPDRGRIEENLSAEQRHRPRRFREPLVPADADADAAELRAPDFEAGVAGTEIEFFLIARTVGNVALAVKAKDLAAGVDHDERVVIFLPVALRSEE